MKKSVHDIGLDVHKESSAVCGRATVVVKETDILAALARRSRKVREDFLIGEPRAALADSLCPGLSPFTLTGFQSGLWLVFNAAKRNEDGVRVLKIEREKKFSRAELLFLDGAGLMGVRHHIIFSKFLRAIMEAQPLSPPGIIRREWKANRPSDFGADRKSHESSTPKLPTPTQ